MQNSSNEKQLWLRQLRWREMTRTLIGTPLTLSPEGVHWEKCREASGYRKILQNEKTMPNELCLVPLERQNSHTSLMKSPLTTSNL